MSALFVRTLSSDAKQQSNFKIWLKDSDGCDDIAEAGEGTVCHVVCIVRPSLSPYTSTLLRKLLLMAGTRVVGPKRLEKQRLRT